MHCRQTTCVLKDLSNSTHAGVQSRALVSMPGQTVLMPKQGRAKAIIRACLHFMLEHAAGHAAGKQGFRVKIQDRQRATKASPLRYQSVPIHRSITFHHGVEIRGGEGGHSGLVALLPRVHKCMQVALMNGWTDRLINPFRGSEFFVATARKQWWWW